MYYSNSTTKDFLTWRASITTAPDPPSNLSIDADANPGKVATLNWEPPSVGGYSGFRLKVKPRTDLTQSVRTVALNRNASPFLLRYVYFVYSLIYLSTLKIVKRVKPFRS